MKINFHQINFTPTHPFLISKPPGDPYSDRPKGPFHCVCLAVRVILLLLIVCMDACVCVCVRTPIKDLCRELPLAAIQQYASLVVYI